MWEGGVGEEVGEREEKILSRLQAPGSMLSAEPDMWSDLKTLRSWAEPRSRIRCFCF